ncbi:MAG: T9SS type A sorting domain-containing protein [candidate division Zixibacteria bacterium]|nr:T9SS type A sorting domain-containing protein [candidate division Zixibacteria bacterium]
MKIPIFCIMALAVFLLAPANLFATRADKIAPIEPMTVDWQETGGELFISPEDMIAYDNAPTRFYPNWTESAIMWSVRFTPEQSCSLKYIQIVTYEGAGEAAIHIWEDDGNGYPGNDLISPFTITLTGDLTYQTIHINPPLDIGDADFHAGFAYLNTPPPYATTDGDGATEERSKVYLPTDQWSSLPHDLNIRAFVTYYERNVLISMFPHNPPIAVPAGGSFQYTGGLINESSQSAETDVWVMIETPDDSMYGPVKLYQEIPLAPLDTIVAHGITQQVPVFAPPGFYNYYAFCGDYPALEAASDSFRFAVTSPARGDCDSWKLSDWFDDGSGNIPYEVTLSANYPNPFNATTNIEYRLPESGHVSLEIFNLLGQRITTLIDSEFEAGRHTVKWDASNYSSGIYFYKLTAGDNVYTKRMTLLK